VSPSLRSKTVFDLGLAALLDAFQTANELSQVARRETPFDVRVIGVRKTDDIWRKMQLTRW
jgi:hypothetical protein